MIKYGYSKYEEFIQNYRKDTNDINDRKTKEIYILDEIGLNLDTNLNFTMLNNCCILDFKFNLYDEIVITLDCHKSPCNIKYIELVFEDIMYYDTNNIYCGNIEFTCLKEGFRLQINEKKKSKQGKNVNICLIEAKFLTLKKTVLPKIAKRNIYEYDRFKDKKKLVENLQKNWNLSYEDAFKVSKSRYMRIFMYMQENWCLDEYGDLDENMINGLNISNDLKYFLLNIGCFDCSVKVYGKTYKHDEFYLRIYMDESDYFPSGKGYEYKLIQIRFIGVKSLNIEPEICGRINYRYEKIYCDNSYQLGLCIDGEFMNIHAEDVVIDVLI